MPQISQFAQVDRYVGQLDGPESKHALSVLRLKEGDSIYLFDGLGHEAHARIVSTRKHSLEYEVMERVNDPVASRQLVLAIALPKGDRQKTLVDAATELGVSQLIPLRTQRGVAQPTDSALERLNRYVIEACKQCGRNHLMTIAQPVDIDALDAIDAHISTMSHDSPPGLKLVAHPYAIESSASVPALHSQLNESIQSATIVVGPEGGLTDSEVQQLVSQGWSIVSLGPLILRIEIAAISAIAQIAGKWA